MKKEQLLEAYHSIIHAISESTDPRAQNMLDNELQEIKRKLYELTH